jgi:hypothetical protein
MMLDANRLRLTTADGCLKVLLLTLGPKPLPYPRPSGLGVVSASTYTSGLATLVAWLSCLSTLLSTFKSGVPRLAP